MRVTCGEGGERALEELASAAGRGRPYQILLTDLFMPGMDGYELIERIRSGSVSASIPAILLSSGMPVARAERSESLQIAAYLNKPVRRSELLAALHVAAGGVVAVETHASAVPAAPVQGQGLQVLLAEDNKVNQAVATRVLKKMGHFLVVANNGEEALARMAEQHFDLVLMDIQMPVMDGITTTRQIRERERSTGDHMPIIAMTAHAMKGDRERCLEAGMDGYVAKPIRVQDLKDAITSVLYVPGDTGAEQHADVSPVGVNGVVGD